MMTNLINFCGVVPGDVLSISSTIAQTEDGIFSDGLSRRKAFLFGDNNSSSFHLNEEPKQERTEKWLHDQSSKDGDAVSSSSLLNINASHFANSDDGLYIASII